MKERHLSERKTVLSVKGKYEKLLLRYYYVQKTGGLSNTTISGTPEMFGTSKDLTRERSSSNSTGS